VARLRWLSKQSLTISSAMAQRHPAPLNLPHQRLISVPLAVQNALPAFIALNTNDLPMFLRHLDLTHSA
jgi:hypothetical protein